MILKIDTRERNDEMYELLLNLCDTVIDEVQTVGDYCWYNDDGSHTGIAIEAKFMDTDDFYKSLSNGHLDSQIQDLCQYPHPILLIIGKYDPKHYRHRFTRDQFLSKHASDTIRTDVKVIWYERISDAAKFISVLPKQLEKGAKVEVFAQRHSKTRNRQNHNLNQFLALPSIGVKRAETLCDKYITFYNFLKDAEYGNVKDLPKASREYVASIIGMDEDKLIPEVEKWKGIPGLGKTNIDKYIADGFTRETFIWSVKEGHLKASNKITEWCKLQ
jgi:ERCC4-type nuclease